MAAWTDLTARLLNNLIMNLWLKTQLLGLKRNRFSFLSLSELLSADGKLLTQVCQGFKLHCFQTTFCSVYLKVDKPIYRGAIYEGALPTQYFWGWLNKMCPKNPDFGSYLLFAPLKNITKWRPCLPIYQYYCLPKINSGQKRFFLQDIQAIHFWTV